jgi:hypothetical protein
MADELKELYLREQEARTAVMEEAVKTEKLRQETEKSAAAANAERTATDLAYRTKTMAEDSERLKAQLEHLVASKEHFAYVRRVEDARFPLLEREVLAFERIADVLYSILNRMP